MATTFKRLLVGNSLKKGSLLFKKGVIVTSVPYHLER